MTARLPFTQAAVRRAITAVHKAGLRVKEVKPDGTVVVQDGENAPDRVPDSSTGAQTAKAPSKWEDVEA